VLPNDSFTVLDFVALLLGNRIYMIKIFLLLWKPDVFTNYTNLEIGFYSNFVAWNLGTGQFFGTPSEHLHAKIGS
jgi:hypothetical protein